MSIDNLENCDYQNWGDLHGVNISRISRKSFEWK